MTKTPPVLAIFALLTACADLSVAPPPHKPISPLTADQRAKGCEWRPILVNGDSISLGSLALNGQQITAVLSYLYCPASSPAS